MAQQLVGIRREDKSEWERRVPLTPGAVGRLVNEHGLRVQVESSPTRVFSDQAYRDQGAEIVDDACGSDVVLAVKEIPLKLFKPGGTYVFFSHTIKGQPYNMAMLRRLMELGCDLIDYERVVDEQGRRLIFFSWFAGVAGMVDSLYSLGKRLQWRGLDTPFSQVELTWRYGDLGSAEEALRAVGERIRKEGLPAQLCPFVAGFAGYGNVSQGAQHMYDLLPVEQVAPQELAALRQGEPVRDRVFKVVFSEEHMVEPRQPGAAFSLQEYYDFPERYRSIFMRHVPHIDLLLNGIYWTEAYPRLINNQDLARLFEAGPPRLQVVGDVSCDVGGSVQCLVKATSLDEPCFVYDPATGVVTDGAAGPGLAMMAVDNLPCELPAEASQSFSRVLEPFVAALAQTDFRVPFAELQLPGPIQRALILHRGELTADYEYMRAFLD